MAILDETGGTFEIPPQARALFITAQVPQQNLARIAQLLGITIAEARDKIINNLTNLSDLERQVQRDALLARLKILERLASISKGSVQDIFLGLQDKVRGELAAIDAVSLPGIEDPGATGQIDSVDQDKLRKQIEDEAEAERKKANAERKANAEGRLAIARARAGQDPVALAQIELQAAQLEKDFAETEAESLNAEAARISALQGIDQANKDIASARIELLQAQVSRDPVRAAQVEIEAANRAIAEASGTAERLRAEAQRVSAQDSLAQAMRDIFKSYTDLLRAIAEAAGNSTEVARLGVAEAEEELRAARADPNTGQAELYDLEAALVRARTSERDTKLQVQRDNIQFALDMEKITTDQAITQLTALLEIANPEQTRDILRQIKSLREQSVEPAFNLGDIKLPTLYEVRRLNQTGGDGSGYNDARTINIEFTANNTADAESIANQIVDGFARPTRFGAGVRAF